MRAKFQAFLKDKSAATAIEYGLIAAGISLALIAVVSNLGTKLKSTFSSISTQLKYRHGRRAPLRSNLLLKTRQRLIAIEFAIKLWLGGHTSRCATTPRNDLTPNLLRTV
jgi:pilus assembly protein Flp/PilA